MRKTVVMILMLVGLSLLFGIVFFIKWYQHSYIKKLQVKYKNPIVTVSSAKAGTEKWNQEIQVVGSSRTVKGVKVTPELAGMVSEITFKPGTNVEKGKLLVQLNIAPEVAQLHRLEADAKLAEITYKRDLNQYKVGGVSKETVDQDQARYKSTKAQVDEEKAIIAKKTVRAPFSGRIGVRLVNLGQYLNPGDNIANLETLRPIFVDFYVPQEQIPKLKIGQRVDLKLDAYSNDTFQAPITTINPIVDDSVRNILVEATLPNDQEKVLPGMYIYVTIITGHPKTFVTLPQLAVTFNPYGSIVYILKPSKEKFKDKPVWVVHQQFVTTGEIRGNQVAVLKGIKKDDLVVTSGQLKIKNGSKVVIDNSIQPPNNDATDLTTE